MTGGLLDFFVLEAGEYTEQLDGALARASGKAPDLDVFTRNARALRGSATMARVEGIAKVATGLERLSRGLRDGSLQWTPQLRAAIISAVDDVKILVRNARAWGAADDARSAARVAELETLAPAFSRRSVVTPMMAVGSGLWMAAETADISHGLRKWVEQNGTTDSLAETIRKVRSLRGIAALADMPPLKDVIEAVDDTAKALELGTRPGEPHRNLFRTAADVLRESSDAITGGKKPSTDTASLAAFNGAASLLLAGSEDKDYVVPIAALFPDGAGENIVHASPNPPTTPAQRFRMEVVSQAEHLRRLVADARKVSEGPAKQRVANDLKTAARGLQRAAESFGESQIARTAQGLVEPAGALEVRALDALDALAIALAAGTPVVAAPTPVSTPAAPSTPSEAATVQVPRVSRPGTQPVAPVAPAEPVPTPPRPMPALAPTPYMGTASVSRATGAIVMPAPSGETLQHALESGLSGLSRLNDEPLAEPAHVDEDEGVVPIQDLLYRGKSALSRAIEVGDSIKSGAHAPDQETLAELFDLLELATTE
jgi:chemotaxis protein histidine kinase CheA